MKKTKTFDCVTMKQKAQEEINSKLQNMTIDEELAYWQQIHKGVESEFKKNVIVKKP